MTNCAIVSSTTRLSVLECPDNIQAIMTTRAIVSLYQSCRIWSHRHVSPTNSSWNTQSQVSMLDYAIPRRNITLTNSSWDTQSPSSKQIVEYPAGMLHLPALHGTASPYLRYHTLWCLYNAAQSYFLHRPPCRTRWNWKNPSSGPTAQHTFRTWFKANSQNWPGEGPSAPCLRLCTRTKSLQKQLM